MAAALLACLCLWARAAAAQPGDYKARRFDVAITPAGGALDVTETITFEFQSGTFHFVWRDIPTARTDGIEIVEALMDGQPMPRGDGDGRIAVTGGERVRVQWNFTPVGPSVHTFQLRYLARGVIYRDAAFDVLRWRALPREHRYAIDASRITVAGGGELQPIEARRVSASTLSKGASEVVVEASGIGVNGWLIAEVRYPAGTAIASLPAWQQQHVQAAALAPRWLAGGAALLVVGLIAAASSRQGYSGPAVAPETSTAAAPDALPAAIAAALIANGRSSPQHAMATLVDLVDRGVLRLNAHRGTLGTRGYELSQVAGTHQLDDHEAAAIEIAFGGSAEDVDLARVRRRVARGGRRFAAAVNADLASRGLIDPARAAVRRRVTRVAVALLIASGIASLAVSPLIRRYDAWPFLLPLGLLLAGLAGAILAARTSPLSDSGAVEASRWRGFRRHLVSLASARVESGATSMDSRWIAYAIGMGLAARWARYLRRHPGAAPEWFAAASGDPRAFAAFVNQASLGGGHGAAGGGAAGGGGSGAG